MTYPHDNNNRRDSFADPRAQQNDGRGTAPTDKPKRTKADLKMPEGQYLAVCVDHSFGRAGKSEQIGVALRFVDGPPEVLGQVRTWYGSFSDGAMDFTLRGMRALGWTGGPRGDDITDCRGMYGDHGGKAARVTLEHDEYNGEWREKIAWVNDDGVMMKERIEGNDLQRFAGRMRAVLGRIESERKGGPPSTGGGGYNSNSAPPDRGGYNGGGPRGNEPPPRHEPSQREIADLKNRDPRSTGGGQQLAERDPWDDVPPGDPPPQYGGRR